MNCALHLLKQTPKKQLYHNLVYITQNKGKDFVAEALKPEGITLAKAVERLYGTKENFDPQKVRDMIGFVNGFDGLEKITEDTAAGLLDFDSINNARSRNALAGPILGLGGLITGLGSLFGGFPLGFYITDYLTNAGYLSQESIVPSGIIAATVTGILGLGMGLSALAFKLVQGDQKPTYAYDSLHYNSGLADRYIELYKIMEEKDFLNPAESSSGL